MAGIKETSEVFGFANQVLEQLIKHKGDDGKISTDEWIQTMIGAMPAGIKAADGIEKMGKELADLDEKEIRLVADWGLALVVNILKLAGGLK